MGGGPSHRSPRQARGDRRACGLSGLRRSRLRDRRRVRHRWRLFTLGYRMKLESLAAIVTGGASGLGWATAEMLAAGGAPVTIVDLNAEVGEAQAARIGGLFV